MKNLRCQVGLVAVLTCCIFTVSCVRQKLIVAHQSYSAPNATATNAPTTTFSMPTGLVVQAELQITNKISVPVTFVADAQPVIAVSASVKVTNSNPETLVVPVKVKSDSAEIICPIHPAMLSDNPNYVKPPRNPDVESCSCHRLLLVIVIVGIIVYFFVCQFSPIKPYEKTLEGILQRKKIDDVLARVCKKCEEDKKSKTISEEEARNVISEAQRDGNKKLGDLQNDYDLTQHKRHAGKTPERVFTTACAIVAAIHLCVSGGKADYALLGLLALAGVPWLRHIFKKIGLNEIEFWNSEGAVQVKEPDAQQVAEKKTEAEPKPAEPVPAKPEAEKQAKAGVEFQQKSESIIEANLQRLKSLKRPGVFLIRQEELKILATLWKYQNIHFKEDRTNRWTFTVGSQSPDYTAFSLGVLLLLQKDFVAVAPNGQIMLTDLGYDFCQRRDVELSTQTDIYDKFSN